MFINNIKLKNYRNHKKLELILDNNLILIQGNNGAGKSNILEAIQVISTGKSQRARYDRDLINYEQEYCSIQSNYQADGQEYDIEVQILKNLQ